MDLFGLILAGGKSSRMGFDKSKLNFHGVNQVQWLHELLSKYCSRIFVSGSPDKIDGDYNFIEDAYDRGGPMNGILSAFKVHPTNAWLIVPIDMPNIDELAIEYLIKNRNTNKLAAFFSREDGEIEPLPVVLEHKAYPLLLNKFFLKEESLYFFLKNSFTERIKTIDESWFVNKNYPT